MLETISPVNPGWIHEHIFEPPLEGIERINLAWAGKNIHSLNQTLLTLKERVIAFLIGFALMIPLIGKIIWMAWQTFGKPQHLSDPFNPESEATPVPTLLVQPIPLLPQPIEVGAAAIPPAAVGAAQAPPPQVGIRPPELFAYHETGPHDAIQTNWRLEFFQDTVIVHQSCDKYFSKSVYDVLYNPDLSVKSLKIKDFTHQSNIQKPGGVEYFNVTRVDLSTLQVELTIDEQTTRQQLKLQENLQWIQQPTVGFKEFIGSAEQSLRFYGIVPKNKFRELNPFAAKPPLAMTFTARKVKEEVNPIYGNLVKVEVVSDWGWPYNKTIELWFHKETGTLRQFKNPFEEKIGEYMQNGPLPVPAHP
jgi:hypothetical protein